MRETLSRRPLKIKRVIGAGSWDEKPVSIATWIPWRSANQCNENLSGISVQKVHTERARLVAVGFVFQLSGKK